MGAPAPDTPALHASCVALGGRGVLIRGASGSGKSALALTLMAYGAALVSDDRTLLHLRDGQVIASAPAPLRGMIEARGVGLLRAVTLPEAALALVVDMDRPEPDRLPPLRQIDLMGCGLPLLYRPPHAHFPAAVLQYLKGGRCA